MLKHSLKLKLHDLRKPRLRRVAGFAVTVALIGYVLYVVIGPNAHAVIEGRVYRTAQLDGVKLTEFLKRNRIRTVVNLRGHCPSFEWYRDEASACAALGVSQEDITLSANRLPPPTELRRLIEVFDHTEYPIVFHCKQGADRTGLASAIVLLLFTDATIDRAKKELWPHRGHFPVARTLAMDDFFERYEAWLGGVAHSPDLFRDWALNHYSPGPAVAELTLLTPVQASLPAQPFALTLRAINRSKDDWRFTPGTTAGLHLQYRLYDSSGAMVYDDAAGLVRKVIPPGESIDLLMAFPKLKPGTYTLRADMADFEGAGVPVRAKFFYQFGSDAFMTTIRIEAQ